VPILPMLPGTPERATYDYKRAGTSSLYAALDLTTGKVIGRLHSRHRAVEFKQFLATLECEVPADLDVHVVPDNSSTHKTPAIQRWPRTRASSCTFTPTSSSWLNLVECWFSELTSKLLKRGAHRSVRASTPTSAPGSKPGTTTKPFVWTKPADQIFGSIARYGERTNESRH
jgi:transposase